MSSKSFNAEAVLFDMDGTLTDSIAAVEAAWGKVAKDIGQDPHHVIAATHGKRAVDNLSQFRPEIKSHEMDDAVQEFEESILYFADAYHMHGPGSVENTPIDSPVSGNSGISTPSLSSAASSRSSSFGSFGAAGARRPSFVTRLNSALAMTAVPEHDTIRVATFEEDEESPEFIGEKLDDKQKRLQLKAWEIEAAGVDRSVRILPGVKRVMDSIPAGRYAVATSGAKTYAHGCMTRVGITPPPVTITADDKRLKNGKPFPDPFLLAAECLGYDAKKCVVFEDSPSGIRAGVASGATVIAVCTSHERSKIENCGAHYIVENMNDVEVHALEDGLQFTIRNQ